MDTLEDLTQALKDHTENDAAEFILARERDENILEALAELTKATKSLQDTVKPIADAYNGFLFGKTFLVGLSSVILAIAAIGGTVYAFIKFVK